MVDNAAAKMALWVLAPDGVTLIRNPLLSDNEYNALITMAQANNLAALWQAAHDYETTRINGSSALALSAGTLKGLPKSLAVHIWQQSIWTLYNSRTASVTYIYDPALYDFSSCGELPYTTQALAAETASWMPPYGFPGNIIQIEFLNGLIGTPFSASTSGSGASVASYAGAETAGRIGVLLMQTGTTASGLAGVGIGMHSLVPSGLVTTVHAMVYLPVLSTAAQEYSVFCGFFDSPTSLLQNNGAYFEYTRTKGVNWRATTAKAGVRTEIDTGVVVVAGSWILLRVELDGTAGTAKGYINDVFLGTINTNVPNTATNTFGFGTGILKTAGTTTAYLACDFVSFSFSPAAAMELKK